MRTIMLAGAAALALAVTPAIGQSQTGATHQHGAMTQEQMGTYDSWPPDRRTQYDSWPENYRSYFWTLTPEQQQGWWVLTDDQRTRLFSMNPEQRAQAWNSITAQMSGTPSASASTTAQTATAAARTANTAGPRWVSNEVVQSTPADSGPPSGDLPICTPNQQDNCINAWEAGKRGPGVTRPLDHWPGRPASEM